jgi:hypothetical protein
MPWMHVQFTSSFSWKYPVVRETKARKFTNAGQDTPSSSRHMGFISNMVPHIELQMKEGTGYPSKSKWKWKSI